MPPVLIQKASELKHRTRAALEAELGRSLGEGEEVSIMAFVSHDAPKGEARRDAERRLRLHLGRVDEKTKGISDREREASVNNALRKARPGYRERE